MQPIRPQDATSVYQRQATQGAEIARTTSGADAANRTAQAGGGSTRRADRVTVSAQGQELYRAMQAVGTQADVRADRVDALRSAIESGGYSVDADSIARRLVDSGFGS